MFNTMTLTKTLGAFCGALLVYLLGVWGADILYTTGHDAHGDGEVHQAYVIEVEEDAPAAEEGVEEGPSFEERMAAADPEAGTKVWNMCRACHKVEDGANAVGPHLYGIVGRGVDDAEGYAYSGALEAVVDVWTPEALDDFLENPRAYAPGTKMVFPGLKKPEDRVNLIAYLDSLDD